MDRKVWCCVPTCNWCKIFGHSRLKIRPNVSPWPKAVKSLNKRLRRTTRGNLVQLPALRQDHVYLRHSWQMFVQPTLKNLHMVMSARYPGRLSCMFGSAWVACQTNKVSLNWQLKTVKDKKKYIYIYIYVFLFTREIVFDFICLTGKYLILVM